VKSVKIHPLYSKRSNSNDFSVLVLMNQIALEAGVKEVIALPPVNDPIAEGTETFVSGWGDTLDPSVTDNLLRGVVIPTVSQTVCKHSYGNSQITTSMVCAGLAEGGIDRQVIIIV